MTQYNDEEDRLPQDVRDPPPPPTNPLNTFFSAQAIDALQDNSTIAQCLRFCLPIRNFVFVIYGIIILLFIVVAITITVVFVKQTNKFDDDFKDIKEKANSIFRPSAGGTKDVVVFHEKSSSTRVEKKISRIGMIVTKLRQLNLKIEEDSDLDSPKPSSKDYASITGVSDSTSIKTSEIAAILNEIDNIESGFDPAEEASIIYNFKKFTGKYQRKFSNLSKLLERYRYFRSNFKEIEAHNKDPKNTYKKGYNMFADKSDAEFKQIINLALSDPLNLRSGERVHYLKDSDLRKVGADEKTDASFDWRSEGVISPVRSQLGCGSCWAIAAAGAIDAAYNIKNKGKHIQTSPQDFLDCVSDGYTCSGGITMYALKYARDNGVCLESDIPYVAKKNKCNEAKCKDRIQISDYYKVSEEQMQDVVRNRGPISIAMGITKDFLQYESGIFNGGCRDVINHAMLLVGYKVDGKTNQRHWIVKNSWGTDWGEEGYIKVSRDTDQGDNLCQIADDVYLPVI